MNGVPKLEARISRAREYFEALRAAMSGDWSAALARCEGSGDPLIGKLVLIHPIWLDATDIGFKDVRGPRSFAFRAQTESCQSQLLWGYPCDGDSIEIDHMFPYGLGGPTRADNGLLLCREHNRLKGHDVHLLPWEGYQFPWLDEQVARVRSRLVGA